MLMNVELIFLNPLFTEMYIHKVAKAKGKYHISITYLFTMFSTNCIYQHIYCMCDVAIGNIFNSILLSKFNSYINVLLIIIFSVLLPCHFHGYCIDLHSNIFQRIHMYYNRTLLIPDIIQHFFTQQNALLTIRILHISK